MMSRVPVRVLVGSSLLLGLVIGCFLGRVLTPVAAQSSGPATRDAALGPAPAAAEPPRATTDDSVYDQLARQYAQFEPINRTFEMVARAVSPAVVHIVAEKTGRIDGSDRVRHYEETGSGVIVRGDRPHTLFVMTNNHVVEGSSPAKISIFLQDGRAIHPDMSWLDPKADIAVLNLNRDDLPAARFGDSDALAVGSWVLALGSPFGLTHSVSQGIISARGRHMDELPDVENQDFLQTDAAINPGNSGGPLVNMKGEVVGINNSIASNGGGNEGVGFSIPINLARWIMNQLVSKGRVTRGALGINLKPEFRPEDAVALGLDRPQGAWVDVVLPSSPASDGGLRDNDVILKFQGVEVHDLNHLINLVSMAPIGQPADLIIWRGGQRYTVRVRVGDRERSLSKVPVGPADLPARSSPNRRAVPTPMLALGVEFQTLDETVARRLGMPAATRGALVLGVSTDSPLAQLIRPRDVIYSVNGKGIATADDVMKALQTRDTPGGLVLSYDRITKGEVERRTVQVP